MWGVNGGSGVGWEGRGGEGVLLTRLAAVGGGRQCTPGTTNTAITCSNHQDTLNCWENPLLNHIPSPLTAWFHTRSSVRNTAWHGMQVHIVLLL